MTGLEHIVVGLDEGQLANGAIVTALHLSRLIEKPLHIVHAIKPMRASAWLPADEAEQWYRDEDIEKVRRDRTNHVFELLKPFAVTEPEVEAMLHIEAGHPAQVLSTFAADRRGSVMVLGGHRDRGLLDFGGTAREMLTHPVCPLWVQGEEPWSDIRRVLVAVDLSSGSGPVLTHARDLANTAGASLSILHSFEAPTPQYDGFMQLGPPAAEYRRKAEAAFESFLEAHGEDVSLAKILFEEGDPAEAVNRSESSNDLIVIGTHGHSILRRAFIGTHAYKIVRGAKTPVLIIPQPAV